MKRILLLLALVVVFSVGVVQYAFGFTLIGQTAARVPVEAMIVQDKVPSGWDDDLDNALSRWGAGDCRYNASYPNCQGVHITEVPESWTGGTPDLVVKDIEKPGADWYAYYQYRAADPDQLVINRSIASNLTDAKRKELVVHEMGHALGLGHTTCAQKAVSIMTDVCWSNSIAPLSDDWNGYFYIWIQNHYPTQSSTSGDPSISVDTDGNTTVTEYTNRN